jgi:hypothetical protein
VRSVEVVRLFAGKLHMEVTARGWRVLGRQRFACLDP